MDRATTTPSAGRSTIVIASPLEPELVDRLRAVAPDRIDVVHEPDLIPRARYAADHVGDPPGLDAAGIDRWLGILRRADILFDLDWYDPAGLARNAPDLRWVQVTKSGIGETLRRLELDRTSITFTNAAGVHGVPIAEFVVLALLYLVKEVPDLLDAKARRSWEPRRVAQLTGSRVLLVGLGGLGQVIARTLADLGVDVWGVRRSDGPVPDGVARIVSLSEFRSALGDVDALVLACPYTDETHHLIGRDELAAMRPGTFLVNVARGAVVDEAALIEALERGHLGGAALDVVEREPLAADSRLWDLPNLLLSPHRASIVDAENALIVDIFADNLRRYLEGRPLRNVYDATRGY
jgi:phosphoglycerate dehydrogenase-like enzyme